MNNIQMLLSIAPGVIAILALLVALIKFVQKAVKGKNWGQLLKLVTELMSAAEGMYDDGASRKQFVMKMVQDSASTINFDIDMSAVSDLIDELCKMAKKVNVRDK